MKTLIRNMMSKSVEKSYYLKKGKYNKSFISKLFDFIISRLLLFIVSYIISIQKTHRIIASIIISLGLTIGISIILYLHEEKVLKQKKLDKFNEVSHSYLKKQISTFTYEEFNYILKTILSNTPGISNVQNVDTYIYATYFGAKTAIYLDIPINGEFTYPGKITKITRNAIENGYNKIWIFSTNEFSSECFNLNFKNLDIELKLISPDELINIMLNIGIKPKQKIIEKIIQNEIYSTVNVSNIKKSIIKNDKAKSFLIFSILFLVLSFISDKLFLYYLLCAVIFLCIALVIYLLNKTINLDESKIK
ncbi:MAG: hypothetical protein ACFWUE_09710 [Xylanivirga thermophila]|uniref:hypothetical protein n=1 Tax=Xylanivirga thermophila TaxID=2496273 RepID=UPI0039F595D0